MISLKEDYEEDNYKVYFKEFKRLIQESDLDISGYESLSLSYPRYDDILYSYISQWKELEASRIFTTNFELMHEALLKNEIYNLFFQFLEDYSYEVIGVSSEKHGYITEGIFDTLGLEYQKGIILPYRVIFELESKGE